MNLLLSELFLMVQKQKDDTDRMNLLRQYKNELVLQMLTVNFNPTAKWLIPAGIPPYKKDPNVPMGYQQTTLMKELRTLYIYVDPNQAMAQNKREMQFITLLESLHHTEADLLCAVKDKTLEKMFPAITEKLVRVTFPGLFFWPEPKVPMTEQVANAARKLRGRGRPPKSASETTLEEV
tara:strand:+ start:10493 stop:11029 length:537 start_codon:yes stop_codon:yes gene_type:complete